MKHITSENGVVLSTEKVRPHNIVEVTYNGILAQSGAQDVYVHCGSSQQDNWNDIQDVKMSKKTNNTFTANILVQDGTDFNLCFRDSSNNWDNNSGSNYTFRILD